MEISEVIRRISRYQANVENLQLEKTRLLNEIDDLDNSRIYIRNQRGKAEERFATRVAKVRSLDSNKRNIGKIRSNKFIECQQFICF